MCVSDGDDEGRLSGSSHMCIRNAVRIEAAVWATRHAFNMAKRSCVCGFMYSRLGAWGSCRWCAVSLSLSAACCYLITSCCTHPHSAAFLSFFCFFVLCLWFPGFPKSIYVFAVSLHKKNFVIDDQGQWSVPQFLMAFIFLFFFPSLGEEPVAAVQSENRQETSGLCRVSGRHTGLLCSPDYKNKALDAE